MRKFMSVVILLLMYLFPSVASAETLDDQVEGQIKEVEKVLVDVASIEEMTEHSNEQLFQDVKERIFQRIYDRFNTS